MTAIVIGTGRADFPAENHVENTDSARSLYTQLTLDEVQELAAKGKELQYTDLPLLRPSPLSSTVGGYNPTLYSVEGGYRLLINFHDTLKPESGISSMSLQNIVKDGGGIDIRYSDVVEFTNANSSEQ